MSVAKKGLCAIHVPTFLVKLVNEQSKHTEELVDMGHLFQLKKNPLTIYLVKRREDEENFNMKKLAKALRLSIR